MLNAFKFTKQLEQAGFSREQAEIQVQVITEIIEDDLATKQDLEILGTAIRTDGLQVETNLRNEVLNLGVITRSDLKKTEAELRNETKLLRSDLENFKTEIRGEIAGLRGEMHAADNGLLAEIRRVEASLRHDMQQMENRLIMKLGTLLVIGFTTMATLMKFWSGH